MNNEELVVLASQIMWLAFLCSIVPALLNVMEALTSNQVPVQLIAATHSPLVAASVEPIFDESQDDLVHLSLQNGAVAIEQGGWAVQGT